MAREGGFTLVELLVSLTILSAILGLLAGALRVITKNWDTNSERIELLDMVSRAFDILQRDTSGMQRMVSGNGRAPRFVFTGTSETLSFVTLEPPFPSAAGPYFVSYSVVANGPSGELIRARAPFQRNMETFPGATPANRVPLIQGPFKYKFAYAVKSAGPLNWSDTWRDATRLPNFVRLQIVNAGSEAPITPPFVVAIRADAELACLAEKAGICSAMTGGQLSAAGTDDNQKREGRPW